MAGVLPTKFEFWNAFVIANIQKQMKELPIYFVIFVLITRKYQLWRFMVMCIALIDIDAYLPIIIAIVIVLIIITIIIINIIIIIIFFITAITLSLLLSFPLSLSSSSS